MNVLFVLKRKDVLHDMSKDVSFLRRLYQNLPINRDLYLIKTRLRDTADYLRALELSDRRYNKLRIDKYRRQLLNEERYQAPKKLNRYEMQVFSQNGEDGIIAEIFRRIGVESKTFLEIGVGDGQQNNTVFSLFQGWSGAWVEGDEESVQNIRLKLVEPISEGRLKVVQSFVTAENVETVISDLPFLKELDLFSLDIDQNTYWIWAALPKLRARVVVVEYNGAIPASVDWKVKYHPTRSWDGSINSGASLKAYELLGRSHGYNLVGCDLNGVNAFFVREDLCGDKFDEPFTAEHHFEPHRSFLIYPSSFTPCFDDVIQL